MGRGFNGYGSCLSYFGTMCCLLVMEVKKKEVDLIIVLRENSCWDERFLTTFSLVFLFYLTVLRKINHCI